jgi:hypothetical protein
LRPLVSLNELIPFDFSSPSISLLGYWPLG